MSSRTCAIIARALPCKRQVPKTLGALRSKGTYQYYLHEHSPVSVRSLNHLELSVVRERISITCTSTHL